jgi:hypothetical protein
MRNSARSPCGQGRTGGNRRGGCLSGITRGSRGDPITDCDAAAAQDASRHAKIQGRRPDAGASGGNRVSGRWGSPACLPPQEEPSNPTAFRVPSKDQ